jgi:hypothetical protein
MTHHQFGRMVGAGDEGIVDAGGSVLFSEYRTVAISSLTRGDVLPLIALELTGRINKDTDTISVVYLLPVMDAGQIAGALLDAAERISEEAKSDFMVGVRTAGGVA